MDPNLVGKASGQSWTVTEWLNHAVDEAADTKYGLEGGDDASECLRHKSRWRLEWHGSRVTSVNGGA